MLQFLAILGISLTLLLQPQTPDNAVRDYDWLVGNWCGKTDGGQGFCEQWKKLSDGQLTGQGYFFMNESKKDTSFQESLALIMVNNQMLYRVWLKKDSAPVDFLVKSKSNKAFVCENEKNDFPKSIHYRKSGKNLYIVLKGGPQDKEINFTLSLTDEKGKN